MIFIIIIIQLLFVIHVYLTNKQIKDLQDQIDTLNSKQYEILKELYYNRK